MAVILTNAERERRAARRLVRRQKRFERSLAQKRTGAPAGNARDRRGARRVARRTPQGVPA